MYNKAARIIRLSAQIFIFSSLALFASCNEELSAVRDPCDFIISTDESSLDTSTSTCQECFFKFSFRGTVYDFRDDRIEQWFQCENEKCVKVNKNDFFEFKLKSLQRSSDLFSSLNEQRALLTPDSLMQTAFNFFQPSFVLKDRCGVEYQVVKNTNIFSPDISNSTLAGISIWNYFVIDDTKYSTTYLISGTFSTQVLINDETVSIGGSYALLYTITEPF
ncbi:MAG: hypothetical protein KF763_03075 [Cyclobacteriaceae bacterium]|nr:hypothetical protein [Cyclobacteriaceae bacterium]